MIVAGNTPTDLTDQLHRVWASVGEVASTLTADEWRAPTDCPGWDVRAQVSHLVGTESMLLGHDVPAYRGSYPDHARNPIAYVNEAWIAAFAELSDADLLERFRQVTAAREAALAELPAATWDEETATPVGPAPYARFMQIRVFDCWIHDQDIRGATGRPWSVPGPDMDQAVDEVERTLGFIVGKRAQAPDGAGVRVAITGPVARRIEVSVAGRARVVDQLETEPTLTVTTDAVTLVRLACGRVAGPVCLADRSVTLTGDTELGERLVGNLAFTM